MKQPNGALVSLVRPSLVVAHFGRINSPDRGNALWEANYYP